jgi:hypothetical protein|tara:strand:+ start:2112 stop:2264 length:153 start_codon:yes stop_codon:yes gene_type:complete
MLARDFYTNTDTKTNHDLKFIKGIKGFLVENNVKSVVISELCDIYIGNTP